MGLKGEETRKVLKNVTSEQISLSEFEKLDLQMQEDNKIKDQLKKDLMDKVEKKIVVMYDEKSKDELQEKIDEQKQ